MVAGLAEQCEDLNEAQRAAVHSLEGALLVLAGAGSGKTRVVTLRIVNLIESGVPAQEILGLTFTNKAAEEMKHRVRGQTQHEVLIATFHSLGARILRQSIDHLGYTRNFTIYDEEDVDKVLKSILKDLGVPEGKIELKGLRQLISRAKNALQEPQDVPATGTTATEMFFQRIYDQYMTRLKSYNALDFDDLLFLPVKLFREHPHILEFYQDRWRFLLIDEYQDTNQAQYTLVQMLVRKYGNICVVGDPDQSIYSWRGADLNNILSFEMDYPGATIIRLEQNYRSTETILNAANAVIARNESRYQKNLWSDLGKGDKIKIFMADNDREETWFVIEQLRRHLQAGIALNEMVIFYRTNFQSRAFEDRLLALRLPYVIVGGISFYQRREVKDVMSFLRMIYSGNDVVAFERTINLPKRGIGPTTIDKLRDESVSNQKLLLECCENPTFSGATAKQKTALAGYAALIRSWRQMSAYCSIADLIKAILQDSGYWEHLAQDEETYQDRRENLEELVSKAVEWPKEHPEGTLAEFLEELSLKSTLDEVTTEEQRLNLMTLHSGKGLEFRVTFLVGMEEDLFPHANSRGDNDKLEEERRLCYVGMTRAKEHLYLSSARMRFLWGSPRAMRPSRFLSEIPYQYVQKVK